MKRRIFKLVLVTCFILAVTALFTVNASAATYGDLTYTLSGGEITITDCETTAASVEIPQVINGYPVVSIGDSAFNGCKTITSVSIPDSVTKIGVRAFYNCTNLLSINISKNVTLINTYAFENCSKLSAVVFEPRSSYIGFSSYVFSNCKALKSITLPSGAASISTGMFEKCTNLTNVSIPSSVTYISDSAFWNCSSLTAINIPSNVSKIYRSAFYGTSISTVYYCGTAEKWNSITISDYNDNIINATKVYHKYLSGSISVPPTCTADGVEAIVCEFCKCVKPSSTTNVIPALGHNEIFHEAKTPTCVESGWDSYVTCSRCDYTTFVELPALLKYSIVGGAVTIDDCVPNATEVIIPESIDGYPVTKIGSYAFAECTVLSVLVLPESITHIDVGAFEECAFQSIIIPEGVVNIGIFAFKNCTALEHISLPTGITKINQEMFANCTSLKSITMPDGITSIGYKAFSNCTSLQITELPCAVEWITESSFENCTSLSHIVLPEKVSSIGSRAFWGCDNIKSITMHVNVSSVGTAAFPKNSVASSYTIYYQGAHCQFEKIDGSISGNIVCLAEHYLSDWVIDKAPSCTEVGEKHRSCSACENVFAEQIPAIGHNYLTTVIAPTCTAKGYSEHICALCGDTYTDTMTYSLQHSFGKWMDDPSPSIAGNRYRECERCTAIEYEIVPLDQNNYDAYSIEYLLNASTHTAITTAYTGNEYYVTVPKYVYKDGIVYTVTEIGPYTFRHAAIEGITIFDSIKTIGELAFSESSLRSIIIPEGVAFIGSHAFWSCTELVEIFLPSTLERIKNGAFAFCSKLESVYLADLGAWCETTLDEYTSSPLCEGNAQFYINGEPLVNVVIPDGVTKIGDYTFYNCIFINSVIIPDSVVKIGKWSFTDCNNMSSFGFGQGVEIIDERAFWNCTALQEVIMPDSVTYIGSYAFWHCHSMTKLQISKNVTAIERAAFYSCRELQEIILPLGVTCINADTFADCIKLHTIFIPNSVGEIDESAFGDCKASVTFHTPYGSYAHSFATTNKIAIKINEDIDGDGSLSNADLTLFVRYLSGWALSYVTDQFDFNFDGRINNRDIIYIVQKLLFPL